MKKAIKITGIGLVILIAPFNVWYSSNGQFIAPKQGINTGTCENVHGVKKPVINRIIQM